MAVCVNVFDQFAGLLFGISTRTQPAKQWEFVRLIHRLSFGFSLKNLVACRDCEYMSRHAATSSAGSKVPEVHGGGAVMVGPVVGEGEQSESPRCFAAAPDLNRIAQRGVRYFWHRSIAEIE